MLICHQRSPYRNFSLCIHGNNAPIESVNTIKYLGLQIDHHLTFDAHIEYISKKINQRNRMLWKMRSFISEDLAKYLYITLISPVFSYCDFIYDGTSQKNKQKLQVLQNASLRAVKRVRIEYPVQMLHDDLCIDSLSTQRKKTSIKVMYRGIHDQGPPPLNNLFQIYCPSRPLRSANMNMVLPSTTRTKFGERDFAVRGPKYWNDISDNPKLATSMEHLKQQLKPYGVIWSWC